MLIFSIMVPNIKDRTPTVSPVNWGGHGSITTAITVAV